MSIVAHQYNLMSEQLRRGIGDLNRGKLQEQALEAETAKTQFEMGMARRGMKLREEEGERARKRLDLESELQPLRKKKLKSELEKAEYEGKVAKYKQEEFVRDIGTRVTQSDVYNMIGGTLPPMGLTKMQRMELVDQYIKSTGQKFSGQEGDKERYLLKDNRPTNMYEFKNDPHLQIAGAFGDHGQVIGNTAEFYQNAYNTGIGPNGQPLKPEERAHAKEMAEGFAQLAKNYSENRYEMKVRQLDSAMGALSRVKNPERWMPQLKVLAAEVESLRKQEAAGNDPKNKTMIDVTMPDGSKSKMPINKSSIDATLKDMARLVALGINPSVDTRETAAARAIKDLNDGIVPAVGDWNALDSFMRKGQWEFGMDFDDPEGMQMQLELNEGDITKEEYEKWKLDRRNARDKAMREARSKSLTTNSQELKQQEESGERNAFTGLEYEDAMKKLMAAEGTDEYEKLIQDFIDYESNYIK